MAEHPVALQSPEGLDVWFRGWRLRFHEEEALAPEVVGEVAPEHAARAGDEVQVSGGYLRCRGWSVHFDEQGTPKVLPRPGSSGGGSEGGGGGGGFGGRRLYSPRRP